MKRLTCSVLASGFFVAASIERAAGLDPPWHLLIPAAMFMLAAVFAKEDQP